ncbi:MAG TPA: FtsX-like permease family protein [Gaiellaceae bacterium]
MRRVALKGLAGRKLRSVLTAFAIVLGVAMVSGTYVLTDTIDRAFHTIFSASYAHTDAVISGKKLVDYSSSGNAVIPESLVARVRALPDVQDAAGTILDFSGNADQAKLLDRNGKVISKSGNPTFGFGLDRDADRFNPFRLTKGRWATGPREVVIDAETASKHQFAPGDSIRVAADGPVRTYTVVGVTKFGDLNTLGGATIAVFTVSAARELLHKHGFDAIAVAARPGVSSAKLVSELRSVAPASAQVKTGTQQAQADQKDIASFLTFIRMFLLAFGGIALFVGAFVIFNTLSITVAQRAREFATLRTLGASRRQVLRSVIFESFAIGLGASLVGLGLGVGLAKGMSSLLNAIGLSLPQASLVFAVRTVIVSLLVGVVVTVLAGLVPAFKATRVPPIAAVREGAVLSGSRRRSQLIGLGLGAIGAALLVYAAVGSGKLLSIVAGSLLLFVGVSAVAARLVPGLVKIVGRPAARFGGTAGRLATRNATRNPARTASTAAALMIGLALVTFVAVFAQGLRGSDKHAILEQVSADYVVQSSNGWSTFPRAAGEALARTGAVVSSVRSDRGKVGRANVTVNGVDGNAGKVLRFHWTRGSDATLASLGSDGAILKASLARKHHLAVGEGFTLRTPAGAPLRLTVKGIYDPPKLDQILGGVVISETAYDGAFTTPRDQYVFVNGSSQAQLEAALKPYPDTKVLTRDGFVKDRSAFIGKLLNMVYVLLALSVIVSLFGMVNTLVLSVFERTRELGMLRAVGMTRRQVRRMVRHESVITALIGAAIGLPLGLGLAAVVTHRLSRYGVTFQVPVLSLVYFVVVAVVAGLWAALLPARRASRLNVLNALQYE